MQTIIIGGGLSGLAVAAVLVERGERVRILEAREGVALETSFANAGMLTPSLPEPWNGPGVHRHLAASLFGGNQMMQVRWRALPSLLRWGIAFLRNSSAPRFQAAVLDNFALASYSRGKTLALVERYGPRYALLDSGTLCVYRRAEEMRERREICQWLGGNGLDWRELGRDEIVAHEPALADAANELAGAFWLPGDAVGDAHLFCRELERDVLQGGGEIDAGIEVSGFVLQNGKVAGVDTNRGRIDAGRVVVAAGSHSTRLLGQLDLQLPVQPAKGFSLTFDSTGLRGMPGVVVVDEAQHAVISPFMDRVRVVGSAEFGGFDKSIPGRSLDYLFAAFSALLPELAANVDRATAKPWAGLRPMSSDGRPHIGATGVDGLYVNAGHGALGWTMAMGSAHLLADLLTGASPEIDHRPFLPFRH